MMSTSKAFELLHMDLFGPTQYTSIGGNKYGFVIVDDYTRYTWAFFLLDKSDVFATFKSFVKGIHNEFETTIKRVKSDNGSVGYHKKGSPKRKPKKSLRPCQYQSQETTIG